MTLLNSFSRCVFFVFLAGLLEAFADDDDEEARRKERLASKPWYMRDTQIGGGMTIPISPVTFLIAFVALFNLWRGFHKKSSAVASHILIQSHDDATKQKLDDLTKQIKNDSKQFAAMAAKYSSCPSKAQGGNLGKFYRGDMAPPFDRAVFDPNSKLEQTIGPIETQFGWHLIYIHERTIVE